MEFLGKSKEEVDVFDYDKKQGKKSSKKKNNF